MDRLTHIWEDWLEQSCALGLFKPHQPRPHPTQSNQIITMRSYDGCTQIKENSTWQMENLRESTHGASCVRRKAGRGREEMLDVRHCEQASRSVLSIISPLNYFKKYQNIICAQHGLEIPIIPEFWVLLYVNTSSPSLHYLFPSCMFFVLKNIPIFSL